MMLPLLTLFAVFTAPVTQASTPTRAHAVGEEASPRKPKQLTIGAKVPDFSITDLKGRARKLSELRKESKSGIVSLTFWCSFCHSCRDMETRLDEVSREWKGKAWVAAIDSSAGETTEKVDSFAKSKGLTVPILMDATGKVADLFGVKVTTTTVVIDRAGILRYRGQFADGKKAHAEEALTALLAGKPVALAETSHKG